MAKVSAIDCCSRGKWQIVPQSSWGEQHKALFGDKNGYVVCYRKNGELLALASVIGQFKVLQTEIHANAKIIELAPQMAEVIELLAVMDENKFEFFKGFILKSREILKELEIEG